MKDLRGPQRLQAVSGNIATEQWLEDVEAKTISGDVDIRSHGGECETVVNTVSGAITLADAPQTLSLESVTGDMKISAAKLDRARIRTTNGELRLTAALATARMEAESINGTCISCCANRSMPNSTSTLSTAKSPTASDPSRCAREFAPGNALRFTQGEGDARVRIKALNGRVEICKQ